MVAFHSYENAFDNFVPDWSAYVLCAYVGRLIGIPERGPRVGAVNRALSSVAAL